MKTGRKPEMPLISAVAGADAGVRVIKFAFGRTTVFLRSEGGGSYVLYNGRSGVGTVVDSRLPLLLAAVMDGGLRTGSPGLDYAQECFRHIGLGVENIAAFGPDRRTS